MNKNLASMLQMRRQMERVLRPRFPALSDETIRNHAEAATIILIEAMVRDSEIEASGAMGRDNCVEYSWRLR